MAVKAYSSEDIIDKVIYSGVINTTNGGIVGHVTTGIGQYGYPVGIYSTNGTTWNDCVSVDSAIVGGTVAGIECSSSGVVTYFTQPGTDGGLSVTIKYVLLAIDSPNVLPTLPTFTTPMSFSTENVYRKIVASNTISGINNSSLVTIAHGQSGVPLLGLWASGFGGGSLITSGMEGFATISNGNLSGVFTAMDSTNIYIRSINGDYSTAYYRIYSETQ